MAQNPNGDPGADPTEPQVLTVDRDTEWNKFLGRALGSAGLRYQTVGRADDAVEVLSGEDTSIKSVITDGLGGKWPQVAEAALQAGIMPILVTKSAFPLTGAAEMGVPTFGKQEIQNNSQELARFIKIVTS